MESGAVALIISLVVTPIYSVLLAVCFYRCLKQNPFLNQQRKKMEEAVAKKPEDPNKGDKMDFEEAQAIKEVKVEIAKEEE